MSFFFCSYFFSINHLYLMLRTIFILHFLPFFRFIFPGTLFFIFPHFTDSRFFTQSHSLSLSHTPFYIVHSPFLSYFVLKLLLFLLFKCSHPSTFRIMRNPHSDATSCFVPSITHRRQMSFYVVFQVFFLSEKKKNNRNNKEKWRFPRIAVQPVML